MQKYFRPLLIELKAPHVGGGSTRCWVAASAGDVPYARNILFPVPAQDSKNALALTRTPNQVIFFVAHRTRGYRFRLRVEFGTVCTRTSCVSALRARQGLIRRLESG